ncbi:MAG: TRAM domain-containing protein, partial [Clostridia bacterium]|nr:TRAM domain-containing protein [Clostridia bacterium]
MLKKNDQITVDIERFGSECGIAHLDGMTLFVLGALPGEKVVARVQKVEKK